MQSHTTTENNSLFDVVYCSITEYLSNNKTNSLYDFFLEQVEPPLLEAVMEKTRFNQVQSAKMLGVSRGTLRKKLKRYFDDKYCVTRTS